METYVEVRKGLPGGGLFAAQALSSLQVLYANAKTMSMDPERLDMRLENIPIAVSNLHTDTIKTARRTHMLLTIIAVLLAIAVFKLLAS